MISAIRHDIRVEISQGLNERTPEELDKTIERINAAGFQEWERLALVQHIEWVKLLKEQQS
jgi:hypothetical protein